MTNLRATIGSLSPWLALLLAFCLPLSTTVITVLMVLIVACWLVEGRLRETWRQARSNPLCLAVYGYLAILAIGLLWSDDVAAGLAVLKKHWKIAVLPVLLTVVHHEWRSRYCAAFVAGVSMVMVAIWLDRWHLLPFYGMDSGQPLPFLHNQIIYTPMLALAVYLVVHAVLWSSIGTGWRLLLSILAVLLGCTVFVTLGRAGQLVFFVLVGLLVLQYFPTHRWRTFVLTLIGSVLIFVAAYSVSPVFQTRMNEIRQDIAGIEVNPVTSVGLRLSWWMNTWEMIGQSPWLGVGTGDFVGAYAAINQARSPHVPATDNPHNQYLWTTARLGVLGLAGLLGIFFVQIAMAGRSSDGWHRLRLAFPVFFLTIMLTDSYLVSHGSAFLFVLLGAVLYTNRPPDPSTVLPPNPTRRYWLILSYRAHVPGSACSQHIDDRLPFFEQAGITPILLSGPVGRRYPGRLHFRAWSIAPSGIRFEVRHFLRGRIRRRWLFKLVETVLLLPLYPFYLLEKIVINLESEWSWFVGATVRGFFLQHRFHPEVLYSTGGSASAHVAALMLHRWSKTKWIAETQDPLVHDREWSRSLRVFRLYRGLEERIARECHAFVFLTLQALRHARMRVGSDFQGVVIYPGAIVRQGGQAYAKGDWCRFAHFGTLAGNRNLLVFFEALDRLRQEDPSRAQKVRLDLFGSLDDASKRSMRRLHLESQVSYHGMIDRQAALRAMEEADCLLLIQDTSFTSTESIPSKVYEYLFSGRPICGLVHHNDELTDMLRAQAHYVAKADDPDDVRRVLGEILNEFEGASFRRAEDGAEVYTTERAVRQILACAEQATDRHDASAATEAIK